MSSNSSIPFLRIARRYGENYGDVLSYADIITNSVQLVQWSYWQLLAARRLSCSVKIAIEDQVRAENLRRTNCL